MDISPRDAATAAKLTAPVEIVMVYEAARLAAILLSLAVEKFNETKALVASITILSEVVSSTMN